VIKHFGSVESFILMLGEAPNPHDGQAAASMSTRKNPIKGSHKRFARRRLP
jgi:hypothetical protein